MMQRASGRDIARGLVALVALAALVLGVPIALLRLVGSPVPTSVPHWSEIARALRGSHIADATLVKGAALVCWVAWAALVACVIAESLAWVAGRATVRLPLMAPVQVWSARLVASVVIAVTSVAGMVRPAVAVPSVSRAFVAAASPLPTPTTVVASDPPGGTSAEEAAVAARPALPTPAGAKRYVVEPPGSRQRDTLWGIAERHLGNPERWSEIFELNKGRDTAGHRLTNPHWIYAGEELIMPADAVGVDPIDVAPVAPPVSPAPPASQTPQTPPGDAAPVEPAPVEPPSSAPSPVEMQVVPDTNSPPQAAAKSPAGWRIAHAVTDLLPPRLGTGNAIGGGILAAGVVAALDRRRRVRQRKHRAGAPFIVPDDELAGTELGLRVAADFDRAEFVQLTLELVRRNAPTAEVLGVRVGSRQVAIRFAASPGSVDAPFRAAGDDWVLARRAITSELVDESRGLHSVDLPLVTLGETDDNETVLLNLGGASPVSVGGSREAISGFLWAAATELASGEWIQSGRLIVVGLGDDLGDLPGVTTVQNVAGVSAFGAGDVLVSGEPVGALAERGAVLAVGPIADARSRLVLSGDSLKADALDVVVRPQTLPPEKVADIARLLEPQVPEVEDVEVPEDVVTCESSGSVDVPEVEVRVFGPIEIVGGEKPLARAKSIELVAYLSLHRESIVDADRLREALWPGRPPGTTLYTTASVARNHLGRASDGELHLPLLPNGDRIYRLGKSVGTDYERFAGGVRRAKTQAPADAMRSLRHALELVRGRPFEVAGRGFDWAYVEGFVVSLENEIAAAAHQLASLCLEAGDPDGARWATRRGLRASPGNEQLYRDLMRAADFEGNRAGVEAVLKELAHVVEDDSPLDALHPDTVQLYNELTSRERPAPLTRTA
jgi:DNA-binding SARP family transcriptional activator